MSRLNTEEEESADEIRVEASQGFDRKGLDLIVDDRAAYLSQATEDTLDNHLITFMDFKLPKAYYLQCTSLVLQQESIGRLPLTIGGQLHVHDLSSDDDVLMIVLLRVGQKLRDFNQASGRGRSSCA